jgi:hypothetical protein
MIPLSADNPPAQQRAPRLVGVATTMAIVGFVVFGFFFLMLYSFATKFYYSRFVNLNNLWIASHHLAQSRQWIDSFRWISIWLWGITVFLSLLLSRTIGYLISKNFDPRGAFNGTTALCLCFVFVYWFPHVYHSNNVGTYLTYIGMVCITIYVYNKA